MEVKEKQVKVERIIFYNSQSQWGVLGVVPTCKLSKEEKEGLFNKYGNICIAGNFDGVYEGCLMAISGQVVEDMRYGKQVKLSSYTIIQDNSSKEGIISFLSRSYIKGISIQNATKIYATFKKDSIDTVLNHPEKLIGVKGIGKKTIKKVLKSVGSYRIHKPLIDFCTNLGLGYPLIKKIIDEFGTKALKLIESDPYKILEITQNLSFKQVDEIFLKAGGDKNNTRRLEMGFLYVLQNLCRMEGSTGCISRYLKKKFYDLMELETEEGAYERTASKLDELKKVKLGEGAISGFQTGYVYYMPYLEIEKEIGSKVAALTLYGTSNIVIPPNIVEEETKNFPFELNKQQVSAIKTCLSKSISVLTGSAGCGKSTITKALFNIFQRCGYKTVLIAPTAKAAIRLSECTGGCASTIHKFLGIMNPSDIEDSNTFTEKYANTAFIVDEASMLDILLFNALLNRIDISSRIILVGDNNQLPSVQAGNVLGDLITSGKISLAILTDIMRQSESSNIIKYATSINEGNVFDPVITDDFHYEEFGSSDDLREFFVERYLDEVEKHGLAEVQVITPYKKGELGMDKLNTILQGAYNKDGEEVATPFRIGDRVRHTRNNYKNNVFNGETGIVIEAQEEDEKIQEHLIPIEEEEEDVDNLLFVDYGDKVVKYNKSDLSDLVLSYASTVHSSQGSEYKVVFVILDDTSVNDFLHIRKLLYTAVTRGKEKVYILTKPYLVDKCISNDSYRPRITTLRESTKAGFTSLYN